MQPVAGGSFHGKRIFVFYEQLYRKGTFLNAPPRPNRLEDSLTESSLLIFLSKKHTIAPLSSYAYKCFLTLRI